MALRLKYAGSTRSGSRSASPIAGSLDRAVAGGRRAPLRPSHLHGADRAADAARRSAAWRRSTGDERRRPPTGGRHLARRRVRRLRGRPPLWDELAAEAAGPVLELGAGTGRVALDLARAGHDGRRRRRRARAARRRCASAPRSAASTSSADRRRRPRARRSAGDFALVIAPMQLVHLLGGAGRARAALERHRARHLAPGGAFALAILAERRRGRAPSARPRPPLPDVARGRRLGPLEPAARGRSRGRTRRRSRGCASSSPPTASSPRSSTSTASTALDAGELEAEAAACGPRAARAHPRSPRPTTTSARPSSSWRPRDERAAPRSRSTPSR